MSDEMRVEHLLEELLDSRLTPEQVCSGAPELLPIVRERWQRMRALEAEVEALFPTPGPAAGSRRTPPPVLELPRIPGYEVEGVLGRGGMGVVFKARHVRLGRHVALKMLLAGEYAAPDQLARFAREAQVIAGLRHPNIVQVFDVGDHEGRPWFTMELVEGGSLAQELAGAPQPARRAAALVATLAAAMDTAHASGVVHRDIKPANILLASDGRPMVSDFGLARSLEGGAQITTGSAALGTPSYMAPEQALGKERLVGPGVDIYALGALLYELLTGRPPFRGETAAETARQVISEEPVRPSRLNPKVPGDLETICLKCLQKDPARRYPSAAALAEDLQRFERGEPIVARRIGRMERALKWVRRRPAQATALLGLSLLALTIAGVLLWLGFQRADTARAVNDELHDAARSERSADWAQARTAVERARARLGESGSRPLRESVEQAARELDLVEQLEAIRLQRTAVVAGRFDMHENRARADRDYAAAFRAAGVGEVGDDAATVAARLAGSDIRVALVAALDDWAVCLTRGAVDVRRDWLLDVAHRADPDPSGWRNRVRDPATWMDREALAALAETAVTEGSSLPCLVALAQRLDWVGGDAVPLLQRLQREHPGDFWANLALGDVLQNKRPGEAVRYYQAALSIRPDAAVACGNLGRALALDGRVEESVEHFQRALRLDPLFAYGHSNLGNALSLLGRDEEALEAYRKGVELDPDADALRANYARALAEIGRLDEALVQAQKAVELSPDFAVGHDNLGYILCLQGREAEALVHLRRALELDPLLPEIHLNLGNALVQTGQLDEGMAECRRALELDPALAEPHAILSTALLAKGRLQEAIAEAELAVRAGPNKARCRSGLGVALGAGGRLDEAIAQFREALRLDPQLANVHNNLGNCLAQQGKFEEAIEHFRATLQVAPDSAQAHGSLGQALLLSGQLAEARDELSRGLELFPESAPQHAQCAQQLKNCEVLLALQARIPEILAGRDKPADAQECLRFAMVCRLQRHFAGAARFSAEAFAADPKLAEPAEGGTRYDAACFAAQAGTGQGADAAETSAADRAHWRAQALEWLRAELELLQARLGGDSAADRQLAQRRLAHWQVDGDLAGIRDEAALAALPEAEREPWRALWRDVAAALASVGPHG